MSTTLPLFWDLSSAEKKKRLDASVKLIGTLEKFQVTFERRSAESDASNEDDSGREENVQGVGVVENIECDTMLDALNAPDVAYSIRRLVRGLGSPRESSRLGFAVALTEVRTRPQLYMRLEIKISREAPFPCHDSFLRANSGAPPRCHSHIR
jgi:DNA polymerase phi